MSGDFLDSNVLIYLFGDDSRKRRIAESVVHAALANDATISFQVVQEVLNVVTRAVPPLPDDRIKYLVDEVLSPLWSVSPSKSLYEITLQLHQRYGYSFYDSLIVAGALEAECSRLLTEDMQHGQRIEGLLIENPFR